VPGTIAVLSLAKDSEVCAGAAVPGFKEAIRSGCPQHSLDIRYTPFIASGARGDAKSYMEELLLSDSHVDTVFSCNEAMAMGALDAVKSVRPDKLYQVKVRREGDGAQFSKYSFCSFSLSSTFSLSLSLSVLSRPKTPIIQIFGFGTGTEGAVSATLNREIKVLLLLLLPVCPVSS
jgi:hypothetical protein